jgi:hypothetical protein
MKIPIQNFLMRIEIYQNKNNIHSILKLKKNLKKGDFCSLSQSVDEILNSFQRKMIP